MDSIITFFAIKYISYLALIYLGFRYLNPDARLLVIKALALTAWRLVMGIIVFLIIGMLVVLDSHNSGFYPDGINPYVFHVLIMLPERFLTWGIIALMIGGKYSRRHLIWTAATSIISVGFDFTLFVIAGFDPSKKVGGWC